MIVSLLEHYSYLITYSARINYTASRAETFFGNYYAEARSTALRGSALRHLYTAVVMPPGGALPRGPALWLSRLRGVRSGPLSTDYAPALRGGSSGERTHAAELRGDVAAWGK